MDKNKNNYEKCAINYIQDKKNQDAQAQGAYSIFQLNENVATKNLPL